MDGPVRTARSLPGFSKKEAKAKSGESSGHGSFRETQGRELEEVSFPTRGLPCARETQSLPPVPELSVSKYLWREQGSVFLNLAAPLSCSLAESPPQGPWSGGAHRRERQVSRLQAGWPGRRVPGAAAKANSTLGATYSSQSTEHGVTTKHCGALPIPPYPP